MVRAYVVEPQDLFAPALVEILREANLNIVQLSRTLDPSDLLKVRPKLLFIDIDAISDEPLATISMLRALLPESLICAYTNKHSLNWSKACRYAGADAIFSKSAGKEELQSALQVLFSKGRFTDKRFLEDDSPG